jgi:mannan endo-1,4-beta-mannosidase
MRGTFSTISLCGLALLVACSSEGGDSTLRAPGTSAADPSSPSTSSGSPDGGPGPAPGAQTSTAPDGGPSTPPPSTAGTGVYQTNGRFLDDPCGEPVVVRGVEQMFWRATWIKPSFVGEIAKTGANAVRVLSQITAPTPDGSPPFDLAETEQLIQAVIAEKMMVDIAVNGGADSSIYLRADVKALIQKYEKYLTIHAMGESYVDTDAAWATEAKAVVASMRSAGYKAPLYLLPTNAGRNLRAILTYGQEILDSDPLKNVVFGWQAYWGSSNYYQNLFKMTLAEAMVKVKDATFPIQVGLEKTTDPGETMNYSAVMADAQTHQIGWAWWDWRMSVDNLTTDGTFGHWAATGEDVALKNAASLQKTSKRTYFQLNGTCKP